MSDLSYVLIYHTNDWCINGLCQRADTRFFYLVSARCGRSRPSGAARAWGCVRRGSGRGLIDSTWRRSPVFGCSSFS